jgi:hypothetical protein
MPVLAHLTLGCDRLLRMVCHLEVGRTGVAQEILDNSLRVWRRRCSTSRCCDSSTVLLLRLHMQFHLCSVSTL